MATHAGDGRDPQGPVDRHLRRGPDGLGLVGAALRDGGGLLRADRRPRRHAAVVRGRLVELARPAGLALRRPRRLVAGDAQRRHPLPRGRDAARRQPGHAGPRVAAAPGSRGRRRVGGHRAGRDLPLHRPRRDLRARARAVGPPAPPGVERGLRRAGVPHDPAAPHRRRLGPRRHLHRRRLPHLRRGSHAGRRPTPGSRRSSSPASATSPSSASACTRSPATPPSRTGCSSRTTAASTAPTTAEPRGRTSPPACPRSSASRW